MHRYPIVTKFLALRVDWPRTAFLGVGPLPSGCFFDYLLQFGLSLLDSSIGILAVDMMVREEWSVPLLVITSTWKDWKLEKKEKKKTKKRRGLFWSKCRGKGFGVFVDGIGDGFRRWWHIELGLWLSLVLGLALWFDVVIWTCALKLFKDLVGDGDLHDFSFFSVASHLWVSNCFYHLRVRLLGRCEFDARVFW